MMLKQSFFSIGFLGLLAAAVAADAGETIQLKDPSPAIAVSETAPEAAASEGTVSDPQASVPNGNMQSYSVVTENRLGPDGKLVQKRKVWQNGTLIEEKEEVIEGDGGQLNAEIDGETIPGIISRSEQNGDFFGFPGNLDEMLRGMEENLQGMSEKMSEEMNALRSRFSAGAGDEPNALQSEIEAQVQEEMRQARERMGQAQDYANAKRAEILRRFGWTAPAPLSEYWLGASVAPVSDETAYQLGLSDGEGLLIREIVPDSPAAKAGLEKFDILLSVGDQPVASAEQIGQIVDGANGSPLTVSYIRKGERQSVELTPEKRPESQTAQIVSPEINQAMPESAAEREQIRVVRPGMILPETQNDSLVTDQPLEDGAPATVPQADSQE